MKLGLGTAQFGANYGISNVYGQPPVAEVKAILQSAEVGGIRILDTAAAYGGSEEVLGATLRDGHPFCIVTKIPALHGVNAETIATTVSESLRRLRQSKIYGVLFHDAADLLGPHGEEFWARLVALRELGLVEKIGVSVYEGAQIDAIVQKFPVEIVQLPINLFDQRLLRSGHLELLKRHNVEIHARSVFLQGLLLMAPETLPEFFAPIRPHLERYHQFLSERRISPVHAAVSFPAALKAVDVVLVGVARASELAEICEAISRPVDASALAEFAISDPVFLNPARWVV